MRTVERISQFKKDYKRVLENPLFKKKKDEFESCINILLSGSPLPPQYRDHKSPKGSRYDGYNDFHLAGDICVIYKLTQEKLILYRIGTHAELKLNEDITSI